MQLCLALQWGSLLRAVVDESDEVTVVAADDANGVAMERTEFTERSTDRAVAAVCLLCVCCRVRDN